ncbi:YheC/YheD family protein [Gorillibacterium sp. sgz5001074]|uniref:YheC/YheD family protein n=1 Tax=Gorillibacterium sp. sgz5001074 TaxID=3446695 RepID=UPI003F66625D
MRQVASKWQKFIILQKHPGLARHIPRMDRFTMPKLLAMLRQYPFVVAKPVVGTGGKGVVRISRTGAGFEIRHGTSIRTASSPVQLEGILNEIRRGRAYMLQQGIPLTRVDGRPLDYRVKLVKENGQWHIRAVVARLAHPSLFVTNLCRGGSLIGGRRALHMTFPQRLARDKHATMVGVARTGTALLEQQLPGIGALGFDFGIDRSGTVWILEVNTRPH